MSDWDGYIGQGPVKPREVKTDADVVIATAVVTDLPPQAQEPQTDYSHIVRPKPREVPNYNALKSSDLPDIVVAKTGRVTVLPTLENFWFIMRSVGATLRYNVIKKDQEWFIPGEEATLDNYKNVIYGRILDLCARVNYPKGNVDHYLTYLAEQAQFNPVAAWLESKPWDGVSRLEALYKTVECENEHDQRVMDLKRTCILKWMLTAIAAAFSPTGVKAAGFLVFQGNQYIGKTRWLLSLVPPELDLAVESKNLNPNDKDSVKQIVCYWLIELGELDGIVKKQDVSALKAFLSRGSDMFRPPYAKAECHFPRRTVFFGSVNAKQFLVDPTGNRRFWTLSVKRLETNHGLDMQQIWAEVLALYRGGAQFYPTDAEMSLINEANIAHEVTEPIEELLQNHYDWSRHGRDLSATACALSIGLTKPTRADVLHVSQAVFKLNGGKPMRKSNGSKLLWMGTPR